MASVLRHPPRSRGIAGRDVQFDIPAAGEREKPPYHSRLGDGLGAPAKLAPEIQPEGYFHFFDKFL
ncbi:hypothetical protein RsS62_00100 [Rhizobium dioscoreae]|nr:hypothetical protein RsS62_00100 [Rhizobium dioscoreae]